MADWSPPANVFISAELKRRGIVAIKDALLHGPVHLLKRNQPASVVLSELHYRHLQRQAAQAPRPQQKALQWLLQQPEASGPRSKAATSTCC